MGINLLVFGYYKTMREIRAEKDCIYDPLSAILVKLIFYLPLNHTKQDHRKKEKYPLYSLHRSKAGCSSRDSYFKLWLHPPLWGLQLFY